MDDKNNQQQPVDSTTQEDSIHQNQATSSSLIRSVTDVELDCKQEFSIVTDVMPYGDGDSDVPTQRPTHTRVNTQDKDLQYFQDCADDLKSEMPYQESDNGDYGENYNLSVVSMSGNSVPLVENKSQVKDAKQEMHNNLLKALDTSLTDKNKLEDLKEKLDSLDLLSKWETENIKTVMELLTLLEDTQKIEAGKYNWLITAVMCLHEPSVRLIEKCQREMLMTELHHQKEIGNVSTTTDSCDGKRINENAKAKLGYRPSPEYKLERSKNGYSGLLIIFNEFTMERKGTERDACCLENLFQRNNFNVLVHENINRTSMLALLRGDIQKDITMNDYSQVFVAIMTHGNTTEIALGGPYKGRQETITLDEITEEFKLKELAGRPKIFLVQACRGKEWQKTLPLKTGVQVDADKGQQPGLRTPAESDILICHAQVKGFVAYRDEDQGSFFMQEICKVFEQNICHHHLLDMMTMVNQRVAGRVNQSSSLDGREYSQMPCQVSTLTRRLFLRSPDV